MKEARKGHNEGLQEVAAEVEQLDKALAALEKQIGSAQSNMVDFLKSHNIPFQMR